jgi:hypothetical protein
LRVAAAARGGYLGRDGFLGVIMAWVLYFLLLPVFTVVPTWLLMRMIFPRLY